MKTHFGIKVIFQECRKDLPIPILLFPLTLAFRFSCYYGYNQVETVTWLSYLPYLGVLFYAFLIYFATRFLKTNRFLSFSIYLLLINLLAISGVFILIPGIVGERFIFWDLLVSV